MFPNEIVENILLHITDVEDICNCRLVSKDFKEIINMTRELTSFSDKIVKKEFLSLFPKLKHLRVPTNFIFVSLGDLNDFDTLSLEIKNKLQFEKLFKSLNTITFRMKTKEIFNIMHFIDDFLFSINVKKTIKIYTKTSIYWISQYRYGKYEKGGFEFNGIDEQIMDACKCRTLMSNKKPHHYYPVQNYVYMSTIEDLNSFDYFPSPSLTNYAWVPIKSEAIGYSKNLSESIYEITEINPNIKTYEMPILEKDIPHLKSVFPNLKNMLLLKDDILFYKRKQLRLQDIQGAEQYLDSQF